MRALHRHYCRRAKVTLNGVICRASLMSSVSIGGSYAMTVTALGHHTLNRPYIAARSLHSRYIHTYIHDYTTSLRVITV